MSSQFLLLKLIEEKHGRNSAEQQVYSAQKIQLELNSFDALKFRLASTVLFKLTAESEPIKDILLLYTAYLKRRDGLVLTAADVSCLEELCS